MAFTAFGPILLTCPKCHEAKDEASFSLNKLALSGRFSYCKKCESGRLRKYYQDNRERRIEAIRKYHSEHREISALKRKEWRQNNLEKSRASARLHYVKNKTTYISRATKRDKDHPIERNARYLARCAAKRTSKPLWANNFFIMEAYRLRKLREKICGGKWHVDHIVPLKSPIVCGLHWEGNLQVIPGAENFSKSNKRWPNMP